MHVLTIATDGLGDHTSVVHDGTTAVVVDPQRDVDRVHGALAREGLALGAVCETHVHDDYVTGGLELARAAGVPYLVNEADPVAFDRDPVRDGDVRTVGRLRLRVVATPGHTPTHLSYVVDDGVGSPAVFSGGSLLHGSVGRTDLVDPARAEEYARDQHRSARRLADLVPDLARLHPTHGFGSACAAGAVGSTASGTIGFERVANEVFREPDAARFAARLVAGLSPYPAYYAHMGARNLAGPAPVDLSPLPLVGTREVVARIAAGEWVVDLRERAAFAHAHVPGSISIPSSLQLATWLGSLIPWGAPVTLLGADEDQVADAQRRLARIGIDRPAGRSADVRSLLSRGATGYPVRRFPDLQDAPDAVVLDVRRDDEHAAAHIPGAVHIPLPQLLGRLDELPARPLWVHCQSAYRASIAASLLDRAGHDVVLVADEFDHAVELGLAAA